MVDSPQRTGFFSSVWILAKRPLPSLASLSLERPISGHSNNHVPLDERHIVTEASQDTYNCTVPA
jgi:hypothetical protein